MLGTPPRARRSAHASGLGLYATARGVCPQWNVGVHDSCTHVEAQYRAAGQFMNVQTRPVVLVVDDDASIREMIRTALAEDGFEVRTAPDGVAALEAFRAAQPDAIVLDLQMPRMDGWHFCDELRKLTHAWPIPIVIVSASGHLDPPCEELAPAAALAKPFDIEQLVTTVRRVMGSPFVSVTPVGEGRGRTSASPRRI